MPNNRSDAALRERLGIAEKATQGPWVLQDNGAIPLVYGPNGERIAKAIDNHTDAAHIAASSPDVVREDIEEILRLRREVARLNKEADWLGLRLWGTGGVPPVEDFDVRADRIKMWRKAARKAVEEEERHG